MQLSFRDYVIVLTLKQILINYILVSHKFTRISTCLRLIQSYKTVKQQDSLGMARNFSGPSEEGEVDRKYITYYLLSHFLAMNL